MIKFTHNDPSLESQWRALILFGKNSATYKFAFAKSLIVLSKNNKSEISLNDLSGPFSASICEHLKTNNKQGNSKSSKFLDKCRDFNKGVVSKEELHGITEKLGFVNVVDAFQIVNKDMIPNPFYTKAYSKGEKKIILTDEFFRLKDQFQFNNFFDETEARWRLVETAWNMEINPNLLEIKHDIKDGILYLRTNTMKRIDVTSSREALNGYQKGKCFYCNNEISIIPGSDRLCQVDHFLPHINKLTHKDMNINGVWNLVLACKNCNGTNEKGTKVPETKYLEKLELRNEYYISSKHPLAETIINQTGKLKEQRDRFLKEQYKIALENCIHKWKPKFLFSDNSDY